MANEFIGLIRADVEVWAADLEKARELLSISDACVRAQSPFDRCARIGLPQLKYDVSVEMYLAYLTTQALAWSTLEISALKGIVASLRPVFEALPYNLPEKVWLLQTTGREEAAAAYTKHDDTIVLPTNMVASLRAMDAGGDPLHPGYSDDFLANVITHEFFHLLSKNNPAQRQRWYETVCYRELPNPVVLPDVPYPKGTSDNFTMADLKITNPDAPLINVVIDLSPGAGEAEVPMAPVLVSSGPYRGGAFFDTLEWIFLEIEIEQGARIKIGPNGPVCHASQMLMAHYREKVGYYLSGELFHPDELLAQSFAAAAKQYKPPLLEKIAESIWPT